MKKVILTFALLLSLFGNAQIEKKTWLLGGNANLGLGTMLGSYISLSPNLGYFVTKRFCPGISSTISYSKFEKISRFSVSVNTFTRVYFGIKEKSSLYGLASLGLAPIFIKETPSISLGIGHVWFFNKNIGFESQLLASSLQKRYNLGIHFGLQIYFNRHKLEEKK